IIYKSKSVQIKSEPFLTSLLRIFFSVSMFLLVSMFHFSNNPFAYSLPIHFSIKKRLFKSISFYRSCIFASLYIKNVCRYNILCEKIFFYTVAYRMVLLALLFFNDSFSGKNRQHGTNKLSIS